MRLIPDGIERLEVTPLVVDVASSVAVSWLGFRVGEEETDVLDAVDCGGNARGVARAGGVRTEKTAWGVSGANVGGSFFHVPQGQVVRLYQVKDAKQYKNAIAIHASALHASAHGSSLRQGEALAHLLRRHDRAKAEQVREQLQRRQTIKVGERVRYVGKDWIEAMATVDTRAKRSSFRKGVRWVLADSPEGPTLFVDRPFLEVGETEALGWARFYADLLLG